MPRVWLAVVWLLLGAGVAWGQATTSIRGEISDPSGGAVGSKLGKAFALRFSGRLQGRF